jgi:hypothetical protein
VQLVEDHVDNSRHADVGVVRVRGGKERVRLSWDVQQQDTPVLHFRDEVQK